MGLLKEAGYIYYFSKELLGLNRRLKRLGKKAGKHKKKHERSGKEKHRVKHGMTVKEANKLLKKHNVVLERLKAHHLRYAHFLRKEHKV